MIRRTIAAGLGVGIEASRLPLRMVSPLLPGRVRGVVELGADHAQAVTETALGGLLGDARLSERGQQRRVAAGHRLEAVRLWGEAGEQRRLADLELARDRSRAAERRQQAEEQEQQQLADAEAAREAGLRQVEQTERERKAAVRNASAQRKKATEQAAKEQRLEVLEAEEAALDEADVALTSADEAARLKQAAAEAKARRRTG
jgi:hypothetical protein